jgi:hypothetical protein
MVLPDVEMVSAAVAATGTAAAGCSQPACEPNRLPGCQHRPVPQRRRWRRRPAAWRRGCRIRAPGPSRSHPGGGTLRRSESRGTRARAGADVTEGGCRRRSFLERPAARPELRGARGPRGGPRAFEALADSPGQFHSPPDQLADGSPQQSSAFHPVAPRSRHVPARRPWSTVTTCSEPISSPGASRRAGGVRVELPPGSFERRTVAEPTVRSQELESSNFTVPRLL